MTGKTIPITVNPTSTLQDAKLALTEREGIPPDQQRLIYKGKELQDDILLSEYGMEAEDVLHMVLRLRGGPRTSQRRSTENIPKGLCNDPAMVAALKARAKAIREAIKLANTLHASSNGTLEDANKIHHAMDMKNKIANEIITTVSESCLCERVKRNMFQTELQYLHTVAAHHNVMQAAMKTKSSVDMKYASELDAALATMCKLYIAAVDHAEDEEPEDEDHEAEVTEDEN
jgi:hypothetical protein